MSNLNVFVEKKLKYLELMSSCGRPVGSPQYAQLQDDAVAGILTAVKASKSISETAALEVHSLIMPVLSGAQVETLMSAIDNKVSVASSSSCGIDKQSHLH